MERVAIVVVSLAISIGVIALLSGGLLAGRDDPGVSSGSTPIGEHFRDQGHAHLALNTLHPVYDSDPPTSGAHVPQPVVRDGSALTDDQLLQALEEGNIVIMYGTPTPPAGLQELADQVSSPFTPALAAAGQAVILAQRPDINGLVALAWTRMLRVNSVDDPLLRTFAQQYLGRGATGH
jgi:hypothetical protein